MKERKTQSSGRVLYTGWVFLCFSFPILLAAWNTGSNILYIITGAMISFLFISVLFSRISLRKLEVTRLHPPNVYRGESLKLEVCIENHKRWLTSYSVRLEHSNQPGKSVGYVFRLPPGKEAIIQTEQKFEKRGVYPLPALDLVSSFPFGLTERRQQYTGAHEVIVYPRVLPLRPQSIGPVPGGRSTTNLPTADGDEFFDLREYVRGDDLRMIAWRVSARVGNWMVRQMSKDNTRNILFILDTRHPDRMSFFAEPGSWEQFENHFEEAVELVASLMVSFIRRQYSVGLLTPTHTVEQGEGYGHQKRILEALARVQPAPEQEYPKFDGMIKEAQGEDAGLLFITPDAHYWGRRVPMHPFVALNPSEILYA